MLKWLSLLSGLGLLMLGVNADTRTNPHSHCKFDILILMDSSGSIEKNGGKGNFDLVKDFTSQLVADIDENSEVGTETRIGIFTYSNNVRQPVRIQDGQTADEIQQAIADIAYDDGETSMYEAVLRATTTFADDTLHRPDVTVTRAVILFTDGVPNGGPRETVENVMDAFNSLMDQEIFVLFVGVNDFNVAMLRDVDENPFGFSFEAENFTSIARPSFPQMIANSLELNCNCLQDIYMLIDSSGSIGRDLFNDKVKPFSRTLVDKINDKFPIGSHEDSTRLGVATFSRTSREIMDLTSGTSVEKIIEAIDLMNFADSWTHLVEYARAAGEKLLQSSRPGVPMRLILMTDGLPTHENAQQRVNETKEKLIEAIEEFKAKNIHTSIFGFQGTKGPKFEDQGDFEDVFKGYENISHLYVSIDSNPLDNVDDRFTEGVAETFVSGMDARCGVISRELLPLCTDHQVELVILLDDTSFQAWMESKSVAMAILEQLEGYGRVAITIVTSENIIDPENLENMAFTEPDGMNLLVKALNHSRMAFNMANTLYPRPLQVVLAIHSGKLDYDMDMHFDTTMSSLKTVAYGALKAMNIQIHSMPLSMTNKQGMEVLRRMHSLPGHLLPADDNYAEVLQIRCSMLPELPCEYQDVILLVDVSGSSDINEVKVQVKNVLQFFKDSNMGNYINVALVTFSEYTTIHFDLEAGQIGDETVYNDMISTIDGFMMSRHPMTNLAYALNVVTFTIFRSHGDRMSTTNGDPLSSMPSNNHIIIFSDGQVNMMTRGEMNTMSAVTDAMQEANLFWFKPQGIEMGGYSDTGYQTMLKEEAELQQVLADACPRPREILPCETEQVFFFVDSSGSTEDNNHDYEDIKCYVASVIDDYYEMVPDGAKVGVAFYSNGIEPNRERNLINLGDYKGTSARADMLEKIKEHERLGSGTRLQLAFNQVFDRQPELDRTKIHLVFVTDGETTNESEGRNLLRNEKDNFGGMSAVLYSTKFESLGMMDELESEQVLRPEEGQTKIEPINTPENRKWLLDRLCPGNTMTVGAPYCS